MTNTAIVIQSIIKKTSLTLVMLAMLLMANPAKGQLQIFATLDSLSYTYTNPTFSVYLRLVSGSTFDVNTVQTQNLNDTLKIDLCITNHFTAQPLLYDTIIHIPMQPNEVPNNLLATIYTDEVGGVCANDTATQPYLLPVLGVGLGELADAQNSITIYPNPTKGVINLTLDNNLRISEIILYDITGRIAKIYNAAQRKLDIKDFASGQYFLKLKTEKGVITKRVQLE